MCPTCSRSRECICSNPATTTALLHINRFPPSLSDNACQASETPRVSALRFCGQNLPAIESALGVNIVDEVVPGGDDDDDDDDVVAGEGVGRGGGGRGNERESLKEACAMVVEDAINAVLLGLRERVRRPRAHALTRECIRVQTLGSEKFLTD